MTPPVIVADRFAADGTSWIDLATGAAVRLRVDRAGDRAAQVCHAERCARLWPLRHPALQPLVDFGPIDAERVFEAIGVLPPLPVVADSARRHRAHALQFLLAHGIDAPGDASPAILRPLTGGSTRGPKPIGVRLQRRTTDRVLEEAMDAAGPGGPALLTVHGSPGSGLRTCRGIAARAARLRGYVPVAARVLAARRWLFDVLVERHVCVLCDDSCTSSERREVQALLTALGRASTRRHLVIRFTRTAAAGWSVVPLESMGVPTMTAMVFVQDGKPSAAALLDAALGAGGLPGPFLHRLGAVAFEPHVPRSLVVHERVEPYGGDATAGSASATRPASGLSRTAAVLTRAPARALALARSGRHEAAIRLLARGIRVLAARGHADRAAACAIQMGHIELGRGLAAGAAAAFEQGRALAIDAAIAREASVGLAEAWIEDGRLREAEALVRSVDAAATLVDGAGDCRIDRALAWCLYWQGRYVEASLVLQARSGADAECLALAALVELADGAVAEAVARARRAAQLVQADQPPPIVERALATVLLAAGDVPSAHEHALRAMSAARRAHRPLDVLRGRLAHLRVAHAGGRAAGARRLAERLHAVAARVPLPRLARFELERTLAEVGGSERATVKSTEPNGARWPHQARAVEERASQLTELETLLEVCHAASDEREALERLCACAQSRLQAACVAIAAAGGRATHRAGRSWDGESLLMTRAVEGVATAPLSAIAAGRLDGAEAVKYGGQIVGAVACRWIAGTAVAPPRAAATLKAVALAAAAPLRAVLDRDAPAPADRSWPDLIGESEAAAALRDATARAARAPYPVLVEGESGSGKELVARAIHRLGPRRDRRFCAVNCAALADDLLEAELFGHTRGAFTGAVAERAGLFEEADGGTLFLDEVGELSPRAQAKLLRVMQDGEIRRVGESFARRVDVRVVAATNRRLEQEAAAGRFRADLRFRLDVIRIVVPPLRERATDVPRLAAHFWDDAARRVGSRATLAPETAAALARYDWPGNVRELQNVIAWLAVHSPRRGRVGPSALPASVAGVSAAPAATFEAAREEFERRFIRSALARANGHRASAAESLGITRQGLAKMMRRLGIDDRPFA